MTMYHIMIQRATREATAPTAVELRRWARRALRDWMPAAELTIRLVNEKEMTALNSTYRHKDGTTNVLSFPFDMPDDCDMDVPLLGDLVICSAVVNREAIEQDKTAAAHWAHMVVHGCLHLLGFDHENDTDAEVMETEEIRILKALHFNNPYYLQEQGKQHE